MGLGKKQEKKDASYEKKKASKAKNPKGRETKTQISLALRTKPTAASTEAEMAEATEALQNHFGRLSVRKTTKKRLTIWDRMIRRAQRREERELREADERGEERWEGRNAYLEMAEASQQAFWESQGGWPQEEEEEDDIVGEKEEDDDDDEDLDPPGRETGGNMFRKWGDGRGGGTGGAQAVIV